MTSEEQNLSISIPANRGRKAIREGLFRGDLFNLDQLRLAGTRCNYCHETTLGLASLCPNCGRDEVQQVGLGNKGFIWTFTVARHMPPGAYKGPKPFSPFGLGLVELPEGLRVLTPIAGDVDRMKIGMPVKFHPYVRQDPENETIVFSYVPCSIEGSVNV